MEDGTLSLNSPPQTVETQPLTMQTPQTRPGVDDITAQVRAVKAHIGLGQDSPGIDVLRNAIANGTEDAVRRQSAAQSDYNRQQQHLQILDQVAGKTGYVDQGSLDIVRGLQGGAPRTDPTTIFENTYGRQFVNLMMSTAGRGIVQELNKNPEKAFDSMDLGSQQQATQEVARSLVEDLHSQNQKRGWGSWLGDVGMTAAVPGLQWGLTYNLVPGAPTSSVLPGSNRLEQYQYLWQLPHSERVQKLRDAVDQLRGTSLLTAADFAQGFLAYSTSDQYLANLGGIMDVGFAAQLGTSMTKMGLRFARMTKLSSELSSGEMAVRNARFGQAAAEVTTPPPAPETVRFYHGASPEANPTDGGSRWLTPSRDYAENRSPGNVVHYVDIPKSRLGELGGHDEINNIHQSFNAPEDIAKQLKPLDAPDVRTTEQGLVHGDEGPVHSDVTKALLDAVKANGNYNGANAIPKVLSATGNVKQAAEVKAAQIITDLQSGVQKTSVERYQDINDLLPGTHRQGAFLDDPGTLSREATARVLARAAKTDEGVARILAGDGAGNVVRAPVEAESAFLDASKNKMIQEIAGRNREILDPVVDSIPGIKDPATNTQTLTVRLGTPGDKLPFEDRDIAKWYAEEFFNLDKDGYTVHQQGTGYYVDVTRNLDETLKEGRGLYTVGENKMPEKGLLATLLGRFRTPVETLSNLQINNRLAAVNAVQKTRQMVAGIAEDLNKLPRKFRDDFNRVILSNRAAQGSWYESVGDLEKAYKSIVNRLPTETEINAYYSYVAANDLDYGLRNIIMFRDKSLKGTENWAFKYKGNQGALLDMEKFEGTTRDHLPTGSGHYPFVEIDSTGKPTVHYSVVDAERINKGLRESGYKIIELGDPGGRPLKAITSEPVEYAVVKDPKNSELNFQQIPYNGGGHFDHAHPHFVKQAQMYTGARGIISYGGDTTLENFSSAAQAQKYAKLYDQARTLMNAGDHAALDAFTTKYLGKTGKDFAGMFAADQNGKRFLDPNLPFHYTVDGQKVSDVVKLDTLAGQPVRDLTLKNYDLKSGVNSAFTQERSPQINTLLEKGSISNPIITRRPAPLLDPLTTIDRALNQAVRSRYFNDFRTSAVESWAKDFGHLLEGDPEAIARNPLYAFYNLKYVPRNTANEASMDRAITLQENTKRLIGSRNAFDGAIDYAKSKLVDSIYGMAGQRAADWTAEKLSTTKSPASFLRGVAFHSALGMFNWVQTLVQGQAFAHILALAPRDFGPAMAAAYLSRISTMNRSEEVLAGLAQKAGKLGWDPKQFAESERLLYTQRASKVGTEHALRNTLDQASMFQSGGERFLDAGTVFFRETDTYFWNAAWHAAYREFRRVAPLAVIGQREANQISARAMSLSNNMHASANSAIQSGAASIPMQFYGWQARMAEQMTGTQLTKLEKARLMGVYGALYGVPAGVVTSMTGFPAYDSIKQTLISKGYQGFDDTETDHPYITALMEGMLSTGIHAATGYRPNVAERLGPSGIKILTDLWTGDKPLYEILAGVSGSFAAKFGQGIAGVSDFGWDMMHGRMDTYKPMMDSMMEPLKNVTTIKSFSDLMTFINTGKYFAKNGANLGEDTWGNALTRFATGLQDRKFADARYMNNVTASFNELKDNATKEFVRLYRLANQATLSGDTASADYYHQKATEQLITADIPRSEYPHIIAQAFRNEDGVQKTRDRFWQNGPASLREQRLDAFNRRPQ